MESTDICLVLPLYNTDTDKDGNTQTVHTKYGSMATLSMPHSLFMCELMCPQIIRQHFLRALLG